MNPHYPEQNASTNGFWEQRWFQTLIYVPKIGGIRSKFDESEYFLKWVDSTMVMLYHGIHHYHCPPCGRRFLVHFFQVVSKRGKSNETRQRKFRSQIKRIPHRKGLGASLIKRKYEKPMVYKLISPLMGGVMLGGVGCLANISRSVFHPHSADLIDLVPRMETLRSFELQGCLVFFPRLGRLGKLLHSGNLT